MTYIHPLPLSDLWLLRGSVIAFSVFCSNFILYPIVQKVLLEGTLKLSTILLSKHLRFIFLIFTGIGVISIYPFYDLMPHREYYSASSFFIGLFASTETYISFFRVPFVLLSPTKRLLVRYIVVGQGVITIFRTVVDLVISIIIITGPDNQMVDDFYVFCKVVRMASALAFAISEIAIAKSTSDLISTPKSNLTPEVRIQLRATKSKLELLVLANSTGIATALVDVPNHWIESQMLQAFVCIIGGVTFIFYGRLFQLGLEEKDEFNSSSRTHSGTLSAAISAGGAAKHHSKSSPGSSPREANDRASQNESATAQSSSGPLPKSSSREEESALTTEEMV